MDQKIKLLLSSFGAERINLDESLQSHLASGLDIKAQAFFIATSQKELVDILETAFDLKIPFWIIGSGTKFSFVGSQIAGLVIKNRTSFLKIGAVKGKAGRAGIGVEEAVVEVDSGVSLERLNQFLEQQKLQIVNSESSQDATLGGIIWDDFVLQFFVQSVKVWKDGEVEEIEVRQLDKSSQIILSVVLKMKAKLET